MQQTNVFRDRNKSSKVRLMYLKVLKHGERCGLTFWNRTKQKEGMGDDF